MLQILTKIRNDTIRAKISFVTLHWDYFSQHIRCSYVNTLVAFVPLSLTYAVLPVSRGERERERETEGSLKLESNYYYYYYYYSKKHKYITLKDSVMNDTIMQKDNT